MVYPAFPTQPTTSVCYPRVRHGHSVYRWRRDRICPHAFHPIHRCRNWVRITVVSTLDHPNLAAPRHHIVSVRFIYTAGIASASTQQTDSRQHLVSTSSFSSLLKCSTQDDLSLRCLGSFIPILSPEVFQGSDSSDAYCHVGCGRRVLWQGDIQPKSVGGGRVSPHMVGTCHCSDFCIITMMYDSFSLE
jgi:hypothetical protein